MLIVGNGETVMNEFLALSGPFIGMLGVIVGTLLNEHLRRGRRAEQYSSIIFSKRLEAYETLLTLIHSGSELADEVITNSTLSAKERHSIVSAAIFPIAKHVDLNALYIDDELGAHCVALFMGTEDIHDAPESERAEHLKDYYEMKKETYRMIIEDSGVAQINKLFRSINRPKLTEPLIERIRELRNEQKNSR
jgi:hypothetical protein